jgi:parallel beta-helix repeat protein
MGEERGFSLKSITGVFLLFLLAMTAGAISDVHLARAIGTIYIRADGSIDPPTAPIVTSDHMIYSLAGNVTADSTNGIVIQRDNIVLDGARFAITGEMLSYSSGIVLDRTNRVTVKNLLIEYFRNGIYGNVSSNNHITETSLVHNDYGINFVSSNFNVIDGNDISHNNWAGIWFQYSQNNNITRNKLANTIANNFGGIKLQDFSDKNNVIGNYITANQRYGIYIENSWSNHIYHNNFVDNLYQAYVDPATSQTNKWDNGYPSDGNYWSDYYGTDIFSGPYQNESGRDGIGDTAYAIDLNNADHYPLMSPWTPPDIAITSLTTSKTVVGQGYAIMVNATFENRGNQIESLNVTTSANSTVIDSEPITLAIGNRTLSFKWNTTSFVYGNYTISAYAEPLPEETDVSDNTFTLNIAVHVGVPGDVSSLVPGVYDGTTNIKDIQYLIIQFGTFPVSANWNPNADLDNSGRVDMRDIAIAILNFNKHE